MSPDPAAPQPIKPTTRVWAIVFVGLGVLIVSLVVYMIRGMAGLFAGFGADLPMLTQLMIDVDAWLLAIPLCGMIPAIMLFTRDERPEYQIQQLFNWTIATPIVSGCLFVAVLISMYLPIFKLGAVV